MAGGSSLAALAVQIRDYLSQSEHRARVEFRQRQRLPTGLTVCPTLWDEGTRPIWELNVPIRLFFLAMIGTDDLDRLPSQRVIRRGDLDPITFAMCSRCSLLGVLQADWL